MTPLVNITVTNYPSSLVVQLMSRAGSATIRPKAVFTISEQMASSIIYIVYGKIREWCHLIFSTLWPRFMRLFHENYSACYLGAKLINVSDDWGQHIWHWLQIKIGRNMTFLHHIVNVLKKLANKFYIIKEIFPYLSFVLMFINVVSIKLGDNNSIIQSNSPAVPKLRRASFGRRGLCVDY
ncbi:hypothetical protein AGLY_010790 [Aphis glycines]|uniref:Uncharacterized protein n=1 Tax=Aphis glycines TaxID=307491 RepID=A0A6G0TF66_APHGL|nr:hypothetical protein AGLY_010790 [Aphis glycines]